MSNSLEFSINARDNTSKVVDTVNNKINNFGRDIAKMALGVAGPLALVQLAISKIGDAIADYKERVAEAIKFGSEIPNQAKALNVSVEEYQRLTSAAEAAGAGIDTVSQAYVEIRKAIDAAKDPTSSQAAALQALGFAAADIAAGTIKPIEVIERLGRAMLTGADDATQFKIASGLLGSSVEKLIPILRKAEEATKGYTDAGDILSEEEANILREAELNTKKDDLKDKVSKAREAARDKFFNSNRDEKRALQSELFPTLSEAEMRSQSGGSMMLPGYGQRLNYEGGRRAADTFVKDKLTDTEMDLLIREYAAREKARKAKVEADRLAADKAAADQLKAIAEAAAAKKENDKEAAKRQEKAEADKLKAAEAEAKRQKDQIDDQDKAAADKAAADKAALGKALDAEGKAVSKASKFTGSSLREIGGALSGEGLTSGINYEAATLDINQKILIELQKINVKTLPAVPDTNFTKEDQGGRTYRV